MVRITLTDMLLLAMRIYITIQETRRMLRAGFCGIGQHSFGVHASTDHPGALMVFMPNAGRRLSSEQMISAPFENVAAQLSQREAA